VTRAQNQQGWQRGLLSAGISMRFAATGVMVAIASAVMCGFHRILAENWYKSVRNSCCVMDITIPICPKLTVIWPGFTPAFFAAPTLAAYPRQKSNFFQH
jgi:hypothetical protein